MDLSLMDPGATDSQIVSRCARTACQTSLPHPGETSRDADVIPRPARPTVLPASRIRPPGLPDRTDRRPGTLRHALPSYLTPIFGYVQLGFTV